MVWWIHRDSSFKTKTQEKNMKILFVDDRMESIKSLWESSGCASNHELLPLEPFRSVERTCELVTTHQPNVIFIGFGLGKWPITGADVVLALQKQGFKGEIIGNSGGGPSQFEQQNIHLKHIDRNTQQLKGILK